MALGFRFVVKMLQICVEIACPKVSVDLVNVKMLTESWLTLFWYVNILATEGVD